MNPRVVIGAPPELSASIRPVLEENGIMVMSCTSKVDDLYKAVELTGSNVVVLSSYLFYSDEPEQNRIDIENCMIRLREMGARTVLFCPEREWIISYIQKGFHNFFHIQDKEIDGNEFLQMIFAGRSLEAARQAIGWTVPIQDIPQINFTLSGQRRFVPPVQEEVKQREPIVISFWSSNPGVGVTTIAKATAFELARKGLRTCLVEWDVFNPTASISLSLGHIDKNLEQWIENQEVSSHDEEVKDVNYSSVKDYIINSTSWIREMEKQRHKHPAIEVVRELPETLYLLAVSEYMNVFALNNFELRPDMPHFVVSDLVELGFDAVVMDLPSNLLMAVTGPALKISQHIFVVTNGTVSNCVHLEKLFDSLKKDFGEERIQLLYNMYQSNEALRKHVEKFINHTIALCLPYDEKHVEYSHDFNPTGSAEFNQAIRQICRNLGVASEDEEKAGLFERLNIFKKNEKKIPQPEQANIPVPREKTEKKKPMSSLERHLGFTNPA